MQPKRIHPLITEANEQLRKGTNTRRDFLRLSTLLGMSLATANVMAACGRSRCNRSSYGDGSACRYRSCHVRHRSGRDPDGCHACRVISETDGCFVDGVIIATGCTVGHRTLRVEDYGKVAATFVDTVTGQAVRVVPALDIREKAYAYAPDEPRHYFAQMQAYQIMPDDEMFTFTTVALNAPIEVIISRPGVRVNCDLCGEEIMNEREVHRDGLTLCHACAGERYYQPVPSPVHMPQSHLLMPEQCNFD